MSKTVNPHIRLIAAVLTLAIWSATATAAIICVDADAPGPVHDGESWPTAYNFLQDALADPNLEPGDDIRVADGTYRPDQDSDNPDGTDNRNETFELINDVEIYGGYAGCGAPDPDERKVETYETILTGVLSTKNSLHVVTGSGTDATAVLDGFTITGGNAASTSGGGMFNYNPPGSPTVINCLFKGNSTAYRGGGMYNWTGSAPTLIDCSFENNSADLDGGGIYNISASPEISNCSFTGNSASRYGGGLCNDDSDPVLINCTFSNNIAGQRGGGTYNWSTSTDLEFINCVFTGNSAGEDGGAMCNWNGTAKLVDCLFSGNSATLDGAAMYNKAGNPTVKNCTFSGNVAYGNAGGIFNELANPTITNCILWGNADGSSTAESAQIQGGLPQVAYSCIQDEDPNDGDIPFDDANIDYDPMFVRDPNDGGDGWGDDPCTPGLDEGANDDYGDLHLLPGSPCIDAGDNTAVPADTHDLDDDADTTELTPLDLDYDPRFLDDETTANTGNPDPSHDPNVIVDMGAYEYKYVPSGPKYCGGTGTAEDPYLICDPNYMHEIGANPDDWNKHFKLMADIDLSAYTGTEFNIIGNDSAPFTGVFDGNGHIISNFTYESTGQDAIGLFGCAEGQNVEIRDLTLADPNVDAGTGNVTAALVGLLEDGSVTNCWVQGGRISGNAVTGGLVGKIKGFGRVSDCHASTWIIGTDDNAGGLVGRNSWGCKIANCYATGIITAADNAAGLVGGNDGIISDCYATGDVSGEVCAGGLVGQNLGTILNCYATGNVTGQIHSTGGLVGWNWDGTVSNCYSASRISGDSDVGGLVGGDWNDGGTFNNNIWNTTINPTLSGLGSTNPDPVGIMGRTTSEMQMQSTFTDYGWDFTTPIWKICDGAGYPRLWWEARALDGDTNNDCRVDLIDLAIVSYQWMGVPGQPSADIAPPGGDGAVNSDDLLVLATNWLAGTILPEPTPECVNHCSGHMNGIGNALMIYANEYDDDFPSTLDELVTVGIILNSEIEIFVCPCSDDVVGDVSYIYRGVDFDASMPMPMILVHDKSGNHSSEDGSYTVLYVDGHVETLTQEEFLAALEVDNQLRVQEGLPQISLYADLTLDDSWMYQNIGSSTNSNLTANVSIIDDPYGNSSYSYTWEFILPGDVTVEPSTISGGGPGDASWNFAAPNVNQPQGLSDSGLPLTIKVTVTGVDYANTGSAEVQFGIALLGDVNNDTAVNVADRSIINAFWRTGAAGSFTLKDCDVNSDGSVNVADRSIANAVWRGLLGQNSVSEPCPLR